MCVCMYKYTVACRNVFCTHASCLFVLVGLCADQSLLRSESVPVALRCVWESEKLCVHKQRTRWSIESGNNEARWISGSRVGRLSMGRSVGSRHRPELSHIPHWSDLQLDTLPPQHHTHRERDRAFIPLNDEKLYGGMQPSH